MKAIRIHGPMKVSIEEVPVRELTEHDVLVKVKAAGLCGTDYEFYMLLKKKVAAVTGCGAGIGKSIAEVFAKEGSGVVVSSRRAMNGQPVADNIVINGGDALFVKCDISLEEDVKNLIATTIEKYGRVYVLVNNAGVNFVKNFEEVSPEDWEHLKRLTILPFSSRAMKQAILQAQTFLPTAA
jgi:NADP-dependent 3-hydroxy acid dehydrogenase YdfG